MRILDDFEQELGLATFSTFNPFANATSFMITAAKAHMSS
jgi:hypothetical protein